MNAKTVAGSAASGDADSKMQPGVSRVTSRGERGRLPHRLRRLNEDWLGHSFPLAARPAVTPYQQFANLDFEVGLDRRASRGFFQKPAIADGFDHVIRHDESESEKWEYIRQNPVRARLAVQAEEWPYAGELNCDYDSAVWGHTAYKTTPREVNIPPRGGTQPTT